MLSDQHPSTVKSSRKKLVLWAVGVVLVVAAVCLLLLYFSYGVDSKHEDRDSIWPDRGRQLIPPTASNIEFQRDLLDHRALYTVKESDLNAFLDRRFAGATALDSYSEREAVTYERFKKDYGFLGWAWNEGIVLYSYSASNGGVSSYLHNPSNGLTYQTSAYW